MAFSKKTRQRVVDEYLQQTGSNLFKPDDFVEWLEGQPEHEMYNVFFGKSDEEMAHRYRVDMARRMASDLRIVVKEQVVEKKKVKVKVTEYPAYISPVAARKEGGGYQLFDPNDPAAQEELRRQAGVQLAAWLNRFRGCAENIGLDMTPLEDIVGILRNDIPKAS